jgi:hypothetical protein
MEKLDSLAAVPGIAYAVAQFFCLVNTMYGPQAAYEATEAMLTGMLYVSYYHEGE